MMRRRRLRMLVAALAASAVLTGCSVAIPTDPHGALDRIHGGVLRVGASPSADLVAHAVVRAGRGHARCAGRDVDQQSIAIGGEPE